MLGIEQSQYLPYKMPGAIQCSTQQQLLLGDHKGKPIRSAILKLKTGRSILSAHKECKNFFNNSVASILETISNFDIEAQSVLLGDILPD